MKKLLIAILLICMSICFIGCSATKGSTTDTVEEKEKHIVTLTMDNWEKYITIEIVPYAGSASTTYYHYFRGALSYALYEDVTITYELTERMSRSPYTITQTEKTLLLNAGGCATITISNDSGNYRSYTITQVSGTITYWL